MLLDRKDHSLGNIFPPEVVASYSALHLFLQSIRIPTEFDEPSPWSIFIFNYLDEDFNYINDIDRLSFSIKLGAVGVVITFEDNGIVGNFLRELVVLETIPLNIMQFFEVSTMVFYAKRLALNVPFYSSAYHQDSQTMRVMTLGSIRGRDWNPEEYAASFEFTLRRAGFYLEFPVYQDGNVTTFLVDKNNHPYLKKNNQDVSKLTKAYGPDKEKQ